MDAFEHRPVPRSRAAASPIGVGLQLSGAGLILISSFVPWVRSQAFFLTVPVTGVATDYGRVFPFLALAAFALLALQWSFGWRRWASGVILLFGATALVVALWYGVQVKARVSRLDTSARENPDAPLILPGTSVFSVEFDIGYYLTLLGAGFLLLGGGVDLLARRKDP